MPSLSFRVLGLPVPQGSMKAVISKSTGRPMVKQARGSDLAVWRASIAYAAQRVNGARPPVPEGPIVLQAAFVLPLPRSRPKILRTPKQRIAWESPWRRPDLSKLLRALEDALTGVVFADDAQITKLDVLKTYGPTPGVNVTLSWSEPA